MTSRTIPADLDTQRSGVWIQKRKRNGCIRKPLPVLSIAAHPDLRGLRTAG
jgi:hypothetical protein